MASGAYYSEPRHICGRRGVPGGRDTGGERTRLFVIRSISQYLPSMSAVFHSISVQAFPNYFPSMSPVFPQYSIVVHQYFTVFRRISLVFHLYFINMFTVFHISSPVFPCPRVMLPSPGTLHPSRCLVRAAPPPQTIAFKGRGGNKRVGVEKEKVRGGK